MDELYEAPLVRRFLAGILDFFLVFLFAMTGYFLLANGTINIGFNNLELKKTQYKMQEESNLFKVVKNNNNEIIGIDLLSYDTKTNNYDEFLKAIDNYYFFYLEKEDKTNKNLNIEFFNFNEETLENALFTIDSIDASYKDFRLKDTVLNVDNNKTYNSLDEKNYKNAISMYFNSSSKGIYNLALTTFTSSEKFQNIMEKINKVERIEILICTAVSALIILGIPTMLNKYASTPGMAVLKIGACNTKGYKLKLSLKIFRGLVLVFVYAVSTIAFMLPVIFNYLLTITNKNRRSLVDFLTLSVAVDLRSSVIYANEEEYQENLEKTKEYDKNN